MVCLASRTKGGYYRNLGRETYLVPFIWENGWPVINPGKGIIESTVPTPNLPHSSVDVVPPREDFDCTELPMNYMYIRNPKEENYSLTARPGYLQLKLDADTISSQGRPSFVCRRQLSFDFMAKTAVSFEPKAENERAGLVLYQSQSYHYQFLIGKKGDKTTLSLIRTEKGQEETIVMAVLDSFYPEIILRISQEEQDLTFSYSTDDKIYRTLADHVDARILSTDVAGGFVGTTIGVYATSNGIASNTTADFDYFLYK